MVLMLLQLLMFIKLMLMQQHMLTLILLVLMQQHMSERTHIPHMCKCHFYKEIVRFSHSTLEELGFGL